MGELFNFSDTSWLTSSDGRHKLLFDLTNNRLDLQDVGDIRCLTGTALAERLRLTAAGNVGIGTTSPQQSLSVNGALNVDQANANNGAVNPGVTFGSASGEGIGSKRTAGGNQYGLDVYTNSA